MPVPCWNNPQIITTVSNESISLEADLNDFITALKQEIGSIKFVFTQKEFEKRLDDAVETILAKVKEETIKVM